VFVVAGSKLRLLLRICFFINSYPGERWIVVFELWKLSSTNAVERMSHSFVSQGRSLADSQLSISATHVQLIHESVAHELFLGVVVFFSTYHGWIKMSSLIKQATYTLSNGGDAGQLRGRRLPTVEQASLRESPSSVKLNYRWVKCEVTR